MSAEQTVTMLDKMELAHALWWFIENIGDDDPIKSRVFFHLRERVRESI